MKPQQLSRQRDLRHRCDAQGQLMVTANDGRADSDLDSSDVVDAFLMCGIIVLPMPSGTKWN
jgi:hypothetical protein